MTVPKPAKNSATFPLLKRSRPHMTLRISENRGWPKPSLMSSGYSNEQTQSGRICCITANPLNRAIPTPCTNCMAELPFFQLPLFGVRSIFTTDVAPQHYARAQGLGGGVLLKDPTSPRRKASLLNSPGHFWPGFFLLSTHLRKVVIPLRLFNCSNFTLVKPCANCMSAR